MIVAFAILAVVGVNEYRVFSAFYAGSMHDLRGFASLAPYTSPLIVASTLLIFVSQRGNTREGRIWFRTVLALLAAYLLVAGGLWFDRSPDAILPLSHATVAFTVISLAVLVFFVVRGALRRHAV